MNEIDWRGRQELPKQSYSCGHCGKVVGPNRGYTTDRTKADYVDYRIYICSFCDEPTYFEGFRQVAPGAPFGNDVAGAPHDLTSLYNEARRCMTLDGYTAAVLLCRKILMHVAVSKGAQQGEPFVKYIEYLDSKGYVPPDGKKWVDHIRQKGNEANHEIKVMYQGDAQRLITFTEMLLRFIYEFPSKVV